MADKNIIVTTWIATVHLTNGQTLEMEVKAKSIKKAREWLKRDAHIKKIIHLRKPKI